MYERVSLPRLRFINLSPLVHDFSLQRLLGRNPVVGTSAETHALVKVFLPAEIIQPVREKPFGLGSDTSKISRRPFLEVYNVP
jgi:hypothetical protein